MAEGADSPGCARQVCVRGERGRVEPRPFCSCPAGLIHLHDCPVTVGLPCVHFAPEAPPQPVDAAEADRLFGLLSEDWLTRSYTRRIRSLAPRPDAWQERRAALEAEYGPELGPPVELTPDEIEAYEREKERLINLRREREAQREESVKLDAVERARRGIKTVVERAQESVAAQGNVATSSYLDQPPEGEAEGPGEEEGEEQGEPQQGGEEETGAAPPPPSEAPPTTPSDQRTGRRRRRRRRGRGRGGPGAPPAGGPPAP